MLADAIKDRLSAGVGKTTCKRTRRRFLISDLSTLFFLPAVDKSADWNCGSFVTTFSRFSALPAMGRKSCRVAV